MHSYTLEVAQATLRPWVSATLAGLVLAWLNNDSLTGFLRDLHFAVRVARVNGGVSRRRLVQANLDQMRMFASLANRR